MYHSYHNDLLAELTPSKLIQLAQQFDVSAVLDSNGYEDKYGKYEWIAAFGVEAEEESNSNSFAALALFQKKYKWTFGGFGYDLKNQLENLSSNHQNKTGFPDLYFFAPQYIFIKERNSAVFRLLSTKKLDEREIEELIRLEKVTSRHEKKTANLQPRISKSDYLEKVRSLKNHIQLGDIYEVNFCQEFYDEQAVINPFQVMETLNHQSPMPFSTFFKKNEVYLMGATPERFLCKRGDKIIAQPIKGTAKRGATEKEDQEFKAVLRHDLKEQNENVMIVDLMRNDLSKIASRGSVEVEELFGVYTFPQVHQMISTVTALKSPEYSSLDVIEAAFPMGSMTGAPKVRAMELIDEHEVSRRGWYSGSVGYFSPDDDFDFNVIIRSLQYNSKTNYLSLTVGGAITAKADPEKEYEECLLKAKAIFNVLNPNQHVS
jgi:para-aminobenzoate synthetase component 1